MHKTCGGILPFLTCAMFFSACEPEVGQPCDPNEEKVLDTVKVIPGSNDLVRDVGFDNCSNALCLSVDGSRPYCTKPCESDLECAEAGPGFTCQRVIDFGELACFDFIPEADCDPSGYPCDCAITENELSENPRRYCAAGRATIEARDVEYGRPPFVLPEER
jgi:hypothetical protein